MKITKLGGKNFRTLKGNFEIPLNGETINLFYADNNGAGKTSALYLFLFLVANYVSGKTIDEYINWDSDSMEAYTEFEFQSNKFKIEYSNIKGKANKTLFINEEEFSGISVCNKKLKEYFDPSLFIPSVFIEQNAKNFTSIKPSDRRDNLKKIFNLDYSSEIKEIEKEEKELQDNEIAKVEKELIIEKAKKFEPQKLEEQIDKSEYNEKIKLVEKLTDEIARLSTNVADVETQKTKHDNIKKRISEEEQNLTNLKNKKLTLEEKYNKLLDFSIDDEELISLNKKVDEIKFERIKIFNDEELKTIKQSLSNLNADIRVLTKKLQDCSSGICPTCGKDFDSHDIDSINAEINLAKENKIKLESQIEELEKEKKVYDETVRLNESKKRDKELLLSKIESEQKRLDRESEINKRDLESCKLELDSIDFTSIEKTIETLKTELESIIIKDVSDIEEEIKIKKAERTTLNEFCTKWESIEAKNKVIKENNDKLIEEEKASKQKIVELQTKLDDLTIKKQQLYKMKNFLRKEFPSFVVSTMVEKIQDDMNEFISKVYYKDLSVEISANDDTIDVLYGNGDKKIDAVNASGAEESLLALSYCYSLNQLKGFDLLLMDEVDSSFTEEAAKVLADMIYKIKDEYGFIGIISHVDSVKDFYEMNGANMIKMEEVK